MMNPPEGLTLAENSKAEKELTNGRGKLPYVSGLRRLAESIRRQSSL